MRVERNPELKKFKPYTISIHIEEARDADLLRSLLNKLSEEVKQGGIYHGIIIQLQDSLRE